MEWFPPLRLGWLNGWLFLPWLYFSTEGLAKHLSKPISARLFDDGVWTRRDEINALWAGIPTLAEERTCLEKYGESYRQFMERVPRYLNV